MKKITLLLLCVFCSVFAFGQITTIIYATGTAGSYTTGSAIYTVAGGTYTRNDGLIAVANSASTRQTGYAVFDISSIPAGAAIYAVELGGNIFGYTAPGPGAIGTCKTYGRAGSLATVTNATTLYNNCTGTGGTLLSSISYGTSAPYDWTINDATAPALQTFIANQTTAGTSLVSISFSEGGATNNPVYNITGETGSMATAGPHAPYLNIIYNTTCTGTPSAGIINASISSACNTETVTLTATGASGGVTYQWQSSPDNATWSNISGATSSIYTFTSLTGSTYYRVVVSCIASGLSAATPGLVITFLTTCPCVPTAGSITANTISACTTTSITLSNTTYTTSGTTIQWQSSPDSVSWSNIPGATSASYSRVGISADTYYRLVVSCTSSGAVVYSAGKKIVYTAICPCSGSPLGGIATASTTTCTACSLTLDLTGHSTGPDFSYQWQRSTTSTGVFSNISGATTVPYTYTPTGQYYYRCNVTCSASGMSTLSSDILVAYQYKIIADSVSGPDSACSSPKFFVKVNGASSLLRVKTYYGDGTKDSVALSGAGGTFVNTQHVYPASGCYTVKRVLYSNNIPQDSVIRVYSYTFCRTLRFNFFIDLNGDCVKTGVNERANTHPILIKVDSAGIPIDTVSATSGLYYVTHGSTGTAYSFGILPGSLYASCATAGVFSSTILSTSSNYPVQNIGLQCTSGTFDLAVHAVIAGTAANRSSGIIYASNAGCTPVNATATFHYSPLYTQVLGYSGPFTSPGAGTIIWDIPALAVNANPNISRRRFEVRATAGAYLTIGSTVHESVIIGPNGGDTDTSNNHEEHTDTVTGPYDPNLIQVLPEGCFERDTQFQYTIHFENLGNDTAHNVAVMDTLSDNLDASTLKMVMASSEMDILIYKDGPHTIAKFDFPEINLLDSSKHGENDGAFIYTIKNKPGIANGSVISNRVGIYFDYADVVLTNTVENTKGCPHPAILPVVSDNNRVVLYPNPVTNELTIQTEQDAYSSYTITNSVGQVLMQQTVTGVRTMVNVSALPAGLYYVVLKGEGGSKTMKFVKM